MKYSRKINPLTKNSIKCRKKDCLFQKSCRENPESADFLVTEQITFWLKKKPPYNRKLVLSLFGCLKEQNLNSLCEMCVGRLPVLSLCNVFII